MSKACEKINGYLNIIGHYMTGYSSSLDLEHVGSQLRLDIRKRPGSTTYSRRPA